ncbi:MAG: serine/threonine-protein kinase [Pirellulaceae bacterium]|jgi:predicted Ser/Thr protein kinase
MPPEHSDIQKIISDFESSWRDGKQPEIAEFAQRVAPSSREQLVQLLEPIAAKHRESFNASTAAYDGSDSDDLDPTQTYHPAADSRQTERDTASMATNPSETNARPDPAIHVNGGGQSIPEKIGSYVVLNKIAAHGQGVVYRANHPTLNRQVVIKVSNERVLAGTPRVLLDEAQVLAQLSHPNVATVYDLQIDEEQRPYLVMEFIDGRNLDDVMKERSFAPAEAASMLSTICAGIQHAHDLGIFHLDLKPANIVIRSSDKVPKIIDFGLAQLRPAYGAVEPSSYGGTYRYMAPEQAQQMLARLVPAVLHSDAAPNASAQPLDARADVYALGAVLYELLTRQPLRPSARSELAAIQQAAENKFDPAALDHADIPASLKSACLRALSTPPADRFASAAELGDSLSSLPSQTRAAVVGNTGSRRLWLVGSLVGCVALLGVGYSVWKSQPLVPLDLSVELFTEKSDKLIERHGFVGDNLSSAHLGQLAQIHVQLPEPSYCYLFALNPTEDPEWQIQLCYPAAPDEAPRRMTSFSYPTEQTAYFSLNDGVGQQAFALITSQTPLEDFATWKASIGEQLTWKPDRSLGVWKIHHGRLESVFVDKDVNRGATASIQPEQFSSTFKALSEAIRNSDQQLTAIAFPVIQ